MVKLDFVNLVSLLDGLDEEFGKRRNDELRPLLVEGVLLDVRKVLHLGGLQHFQAVEPEDERVVLLVLLLGFVLLVVDAEHEVSRVEDVALLQVLDDALALLLVDEGLELDAVRVLGPEVEEVAEDDYDVRHENLDCQFELLRVFQQRADHRGKAMRQRQDVHAGYLQVEQTGALVDLVDVERLEVIVAHV